MNYERYELGKKIVSKISKTERSKIIRGLKNKKDETYIIVRDEYCNSTIYSITEQYVEEVIEEFRAKGMHETGYTFWYRGVYVCEKKDVEGEKKYGVKKVVRRIIETKYGNTTPIFETDTGEDMLKRLGFSVGNEGE